MASASATSSESWAKQVSSLSPATVRALARTVTPRLTKYIPHVPHPRQNVFLLLDHREAFYGGAAGGGKSDALLMAALQYVDVPGYAAILFRRTFADLNLPEALMQRATEWLGPTDARWSSQDHRWTFPSGATLTFGYIDKANDHYRYQSAAFQFVGFDELTQFQEHQYRYLFSRQRRLRDSQVPVRMRAASNPGGIGHDWVKQRFLVEGKEHGRPFIPAKLEDNPSLDAVEYTQALSNLDPITRQQLLRGDWSARIGGNKFRREWFGIVHRAPRVAQRVRYWDLAGTEPSPRNTDPDWTAGCREALIGDDIYIEDVRRLRASPHTVEKLVIQTAHLDGPEVPIIIEQEPGASGKSVIDHYVRLLPGYTVRGDRVTGPKPPRWDGLSSYAEAGHVKLVQGAWIGDFLDELDAVPNGPHDDQTDASAGAFRHLTLGDQPFGFA